MRNIGDFIRRPRRSVKIAIAAPGTPGEFRRSRRSAYKIAKFVAGFKPATHLAFAKCARSRDFLRSSLKIASKVNQSGWVILSHEQCWSETSPRSAKKIARCVRINRWRKSQAIFAGDQIRRDRRIKSPGVSPALAIQG